MNNPSKICGSKGFSLIEFLVLSGVLLTLVAISVPMINNSKQVAQSTQMEQDLKTLNRSVTMYSASGGRIPKNDPVALVNQMKSTQTSEATATFVGLSGSFIDPRINLELVEEGPGFRWNDSDQIFEMAESGIRYRVGLLEADEAHALALKTEQRDQSILEFGTSSGWIWDYEDAPNALQHEPTQVALEKVDPLAVPLSGMVDPPDPESLPPLLQKLAPPVFSIPGGLYDVDNYPLALELINPNGVGEIIYGIINQPDWEFNTYAGFLAINPGDHLIAYVNSPDPYLYETSDLAYGNYKGVYFPKSLSGITDEETPVSVEAHPGAVDPNKYEIAFSITAVSPPARGTASFSGGTITFDPGLAFRFLAAGETAEEVFTYTVANADGSPGTETVTITITGINNTPTISGAKEDTVHEAGLSHGSGVGPSTAASSGALVVSDVDASDVLTLNVNGMNVGIVDGNAATEVGTVPGPYGNGELALRGDGSWTYTLLHSLSHDGDDSDFTDTEMEKFSISVRDSSGAASATVDVTMNITDDSIVAAPVLLSGGNGPGSLLDGMLHIKGADDLPYSADLTSNCAGWDSGAPWAASELTSGWGFPVYYQVDPAQTDRLIAYVDKDLLSPSAWGAGADQDIAFILEMDPNGDQYQLDVRSRIDSFSNSVINMSEMEASGPDSSWIFTDEQIYTTTETIPANETELFTVSAIVPGDVINKSAIGMGINDMWIEPKELGLEVDLAHPSREFWLEMIFVSGLGKHKKLAWVALGADESTVVGAGTYDGDTDGPLLKVKTDSNNLFIKKVLLLSVPEAKRWQIGGVTVDSMVGNDPLTLSLETELSDSDGDETTKSLQFHLE